MKKKVISILLCAAMCVGMVTACGSKKADKEADSSTDEKDKVITVAANGSFYPIIYSAMFEGLDSGKYDTIAGQVSVTDEREKKYTFSDVYGYNAIKLAVRGDDPATSIEDMQGRKICIEFGTVLEAALNKINDTFPDDKKMELVTTEGNIYDELKVGHYDAFPITVLSFDQINEKGEYDFKLIGDPILIDKNAFPFAKDVDPDMINAVNKAIEEMQDDGTMSELSEKYFGRDISKEEITE